MLHVFTYQFQQSRIRHHALKILKFFKLHTLIIQAIYKNYHW